MIGLSTASVYPETTATAFEMAARLGYDAVEVMVGIDPISQEVDAVRHLADYHQIPVCAVHAPCLLITQRVWGTEPWAKLEKSAEMARAVGADVVVVHPPFRWQRDYARGFVEGIAAARGAHRRRLRGREHVPLARLASREMQVYVPGWDPSEHDYANTTLDLSHTATSQSDPVADGRAGSATGCGTSTSTDGSGSAKDEHLVPGPRQPSRAPSCSSTWPAPTSTATSWWRSTPARPAPARRASSTWPRRWPSPGSTSAAPDPR